MKTNYLLLLCLLLFACNSPEKLYQKGEVEAAYQKLLASSKTKMSPSEKSLLTKIHATKVEEDIRIIEEWTAQDIPEIWPRIKGRLDRIAIEENAALKIFLLQDIPTSELKTFPNLQEKTAEASVKAADYYYERQLQEYALAKNGDKKAARRGYDLGEKVMSFETDFKEVYSINQELKDIGMDYVLVYFEGEKNFPPTEFSLLHFVQNWETPGGNKWSTVSFEESELSRVDYWLRITLHQAMVGPPLWTSSSCSNSASVEVGTKTVEEWSAKDSAYVEKTVPVFQDVFVTVTNYEQFREADLPFTAELIPNGAKEPIGAQNFTVVDRWSNSYGEVSGDDRAIDSSCCPESGFFQSAPSEETMLINLGVKSSWTSRQFLATHLDSYEVGSRKMRKNSLFRN